MNQKQKINNYIILAILIIYNFLYKFVILKTFRNQEAIITSVFFIIIFIISIAMYGITKNKLNTGKKKIIKIVITTVIVSIILTYCVGAFVGFLRNGYSLAIKNIIKNIFAPILIILFTELFRYNIIRGNKNKFKMVVAVTLLLTLLEIQMNIAISTKWGLQEIFIVATTIVIPMIAKNATLSYLTYETGYQPCIIYRLILEIYIYLVPYVPKFGDYLNSMYGLLVPLAVFMNTSEYIEEQDTGIEPEFAAKKAKILKIPMYILIFILIALISRVFPIFAIGVGSESMTGAINKGDAVIAIKVKEEDISEGDVIVFQTHEKILIHRVVEIEEKEGKKYYRTKGDANGTRDNLDTTIERIYGEVKLRVPYIAYPSVWLTEFMQKHK